ncbi:hypothetical protein GCM10023080_067310 [Streptomyces pseudoechinosporeus]
MDRELNGPTISHLVSGQVSVSSKIRPAVSGSDDGVGFTSRSTTEHESGAPDAQDSRCCGAGRQSAAERTREQRRRPHTGREQGGGSFMQRVLADRRPNGVHVPGRSQTKERAEHDGTGQRGVNRRSQVPHSRVINAVHRRDEECVHDRQTTAAS